MRFRIDAIQLQHLRASGTTPPIGLKPPAEKQIAGDKIVTYKLPLQPHVPGSPETKKAFAKWGHYREQVAMYSRFEAAQQISESVRGGRVGAPRQWEQIMLGPGGARARRTAGPYTAARGERRSGRGGPPHRHVPGRNGQQGFEPGGGNLRRNFAGQRDAAIPPRAMGRPDYRPRYDPVQRPFRPRFRARRDRPEPAREANVIEANRPEPLQADDDIGF